MEALELLYRIAERDQRGDGVRLRHTEERLYLRLPPDHHRGHDAPQPLVACREQEAPDKRVDGGTTGQAAPAQIPVHRGEGPQVDHDDEDDRRLIEVLGEPAGASGSRFSHLRCPGDRPGLGLEIGDRGPRRETGLALGQVLIPPRQIQVAKPAPGLRILDEDHPPALAVTPARREAGLIEKPDDHVVGDGIGPEFPDGAGCAQGAREFHARTLESVDYKGDVIELVVQGDDVGMCHAVNEAAAAAFTDGILTQVSVMAPCPWVDESVALIRRLGIPAGLHQTLTCEWDFLRWGPLTRAPALAGGDGTFPRTVDGAQAAVASAEEGAARRELLSQATRLTAAGVPLTYLDVHMGMVAPSAYADACRRLGLPFLYPGLEASLRFASIAMLSARPASEKKAWLLAHLGGLGPGRHLLVSHPGIASDELSSLTSQDSGNWPWAVEYRVSDLAVLTDPDIRRAIEERGIKLVAVASG